MAEFSGKVAIVTGAASGIGRAVARLYAREGASVVVSDLDESGGKATVSEIEKSDRKALFVKTDVSDPSDCERLVRRALEQFGRLDFACNNAGIGGESNLTADYSVAGWKKVIDVNLSGVFYCMKHEIPAMLKTGGGAIVNMSSILGQVGFTAAPAYTASKHGLVGLTQTAALDYSSQGVRVNAVGPAFIRTPMIASLEKDPASLAGLVAAHPIGRLGEPDEVAELVIWLSSSKSSFVTGSYYPIDGGYLAR